MNLLALACALMAPQPNEVPFHLGEDAILVDVTLNGRPATLMYDTGFGGTAVVGDNLDVGKPSGTMTLTDFVGSFQAKTVKLSSFKIGDRGVDSNGLEIVQQPTGHYTLSYGAHCDGILGFEPFMKSVFQINFERQKFVFLPDSTDVSQYKADNVKTFAARLLPMGHNSLMLPVETSKGEKLHMALDTGNAGYAVTHKESLERVGLWTDGKKPDFMGQSMVASGPVDTFKIRLKDMKVFGIPVPSGVFGVIDLPSSTADQDGTVGIGFLRNFNITVDMIRRRVFFENWTGRVSEDDEGEPGILAFPYPATKRLKVYSVVPGSPAEKAGVLKGDDVLAVDGTDVALLGARRVATLLKGKPGTKVKVDLSRNGVLMRQELERQPLVNQASG